MKNAVLPISVSLVIPVHNNEKTAVSEIKKCLDVLKKTVSKYEIIICDDRSKDNSLKVIADAFHKDRTIKIFHHTQNLGIAKTIYSLYKKGSMEYICLFSVDGDWSSNDIAILINKIFRAKADFVIGERNKQTYNNYRKFLSFFYNFLPLLLFGVNTKDAGSIKIFKKDLIRKIPINSSSVFFEAELIIKAVLNNYKVVFAQIHFYKKDRKSGTGGKLKLVFASIGDLIKLRFRTKGFNLKFNAGSNNSI